MQAEDKQIYMVTFRDGSKRQILAASEAEAIKKTDALINEGYHSGCVVGLTSHEGYRPPLRNWPI